MNILVTGGAGFIGSHTVVELFLAGHNPIILDNFSNSTPAMIQGIESIIQQSVTFYEGSFSDMSLLRSILEKENIEGVIHFAAFKAVGESVKKPLKYYKNNVSGTIDLMEVLLEKGIQNVVFSSSCTVYGEPDTIPVTEETPRKTATSPYGNTKTMCEDILRDVVVAGEQVKIISLRYFNPVGAHPTAAIGELPNGVPSNLVPFITQTAAGIREKLTVFGDTYQTPDGSNIRDFIHVVDLAKAHVAALSYLATQSAPLYDVFNIGTGQGNSVLELVTVFEQVNNLTLSYEIGAAREGDVEKIYGNVDKAARILGWKTEKTLEDSLRDAWTWQQALAKQA
ncbi:MAG: UDP-glucose 4-epimerase GalE [Spirosomataceae bacterium]